MLIAKAKLEEQWLLGHYPLYADYGHRTWQLLPWIHSLLSRLAGLDFSIRSTNCLRGSRCKTKCALLAMADKKPGCWPPGFQRILMGILRGSIRNYNRPICLVSSGGHRGIPALALEEFAC